MNFPVRFSVIIPFYRAHKTIARCLDSFLRQSVADTMEILCIGGKDEDPTHAVIEEYVRANPGVVQMHLRDGREQGASRNYGLSLAKGEYIMFSDADDYVDPDILSATLKALCEHNADFACVGIERVSVSGKKYSHDMKVPTITPVDVTPETVTRLAFIPPSPCAKLYRRDLIGARRFPENPIAAYEDTIFFMSLCPHIRRFVLLPEAKYHYVIYDESTMSRPSEEKTRLFRKDLIALRRNFEETALPSPYLQLIDTAAFIHVGIADAHRMAEKSDISLRDFCLTAKDFLQEHFPGWRQIPLRPYGCFTSRSAAVWFVKYLYGVNLTWLFLRVYNRIVKNLHIDIKW